MKTSKIILFSYIGLIAVAFLIFVIYLSAAEDNPRTSIPKYTIIEKEVPAFKYIVADHQNIAFNHDERIHISAPVQNKDSVSEINYSLLNDTLYILPTKGVDYVTIHIGDVSKLTIVNNSARILANGVITDTLNYIGTGNSEINGFSNSTIGFVSADISGSRLYAYQGSIDELNLNAEKSSVNIRSKMSLAKVQLSDNSDVRLGNVGKIDLEKDDSSKFYCNP